LGWSFLALPALRALAFVRRTAAILPGTPADAAISAALLSFDPDHVHQRWEAALERRATDRPFLSLTSSIMTREAELIRSLAEDLANETAGG
jgi:hypothetical protein